MENQQDITKTGPVPLQGIRNSDIYNNSSNSLNLSQEQRDRLDALHNRVLQRDQEIKSGYIGHSVFRDPSFYNPQPIPDLDFGSSIYDEGVLTDPTQEQIGDLRANNQPWYAKAAAGILKGAIIAGTTFVDGTFGLVFGVGQAIANGFSDDPNTHWYEGFWNNAIVNGTSALQNNMEEQLPNYRTQAEITGPWWKNMGTANFWFDGVIKNAGYIIGAMYSGGIYTKAIDKLARTMAFGRKGAQLSQQAIKTAEQAVQASNRTRHSKALIGSVAMAHAEAVVEANNAYHDSLNIKQQELRLQTYQDKNDALQQFVNNGGKLNEQGLPDYANSPIEASNTLRNRLSQIDNAYSKAMEQAEISSKDAATLTGILNTAVLSIDNFAMFGRALAGGWKSARNAHRGQVRATKQALKEAKEAARAGDPSKLNKLRDIIKRAETKPLSELTESEKNLIELGRDYLLGNKAGAVWASIKGPLREGNEEMMQGAISQSMQYAFSAEPDIVYDAALNRESSKKVKGLLESLIYGFKQQYGDFNNYEEAAIGAITGLVGSPSFGRDTNRTATFGKNKLIGLTGGAVQEYREFRDKRRRDKEIYDAATKVLRSGTLEQDIKHLITATTFNDAMDKAVIHDNEREYKDARTAAIFAQINHLRRVGRLDLLDSIIQNIEQYTDEDVEEVKKSLTQQYSVEQELYQSKKQSKDQVEQQIANLQQRRQELENRKLQIEADSTSSGIYSQDWVDDQIQEVDNSIAQIDSELESLNNQLGTLDAQIKELNPKSIFPFMKQDGTEMTNEEIKQDFLKRTQHFKTILNTINEASNAIDYATSEVLTDEQLDTLTWYQVMMKDWSQRADSITTSYQQVLTDLLQDPTLVSALQAIEDIEDVVRQFGEKAKIQLGGRYEALMKVKQLGDLYENLKKVISERDGIGLGVLLNSEEAAKDKEGKPITLEDGKELTIGEVVRNQLQYVISQYKGLSEDAKIQLQKALDDVQSMGKSFLKYNTLYAEYLANPEKIDKLHSKSQAKAEKEASKEQIDLFSKDINWNGTIGSIAKYFREHKELVEDVNKFSEFIRPLTDAQKEKARKAREFALGIEDLEARIAKESNLTDQHKISLQQLIDSKIDQCNSLKELDTKLREAITNNELKNFIPEDDELVVTDERLRVLSAAEQAIEAFLNDNTEAAMKAAAESEDSLERAQQAADAMTAKEEQEQEQMKQAAQRSDEGMQEPSDGDQQPNEPPDNNPPQVPDDQQSPNEPKGGNNQSIGTTYSERFVSLVNSGVLTGEWGNANGREVVVANVNGVKVLFYKSSKGTDGKTKGKWYPIFGFGAGENSLPGETSNNNWLIKGSIEDMEDGYGVSAIQEVQQLLNTLFDWTPGEMLNRAEHLVFTGKAKSSEELNKIVLGREDSGVQNGVNAQEHINNYLQKIINGSSREGTIILDGTVEINEETEQSIKNKNENQSRQLLGPQPGQPGFNNRRWLTPFYLYGKDHLKLSEYYEQNRDQVPNFKYPRNYTKKQKEEYIDKFIAYIKEVEKFLEKNGAYQFISGSDPNYKLEVDNTIIFKVNEELSEKAGVKVVVMYVNTSRGMQPIGTLPTEFDFNAKERRTGKTYAQLNKGQYILYKTVVDGTEVTTTVDSLRGGNPSFSEQNRPVSEVFKNSQETVPIAIVTSSGIKQTSTVTDSALSLLEPKNGQIYVYVVSNTGVQTPLLCYSKPLKDLSDNDWYIQETISILQKLTKEKQFESQSIGDIKNQIMRQLSFLAEDNFHINYITNESDGTTSVLFGWGTKEDGSGFANSFSIKLQDDGTISEQDALRFIRKLSKLTLITSSGKTMSPTTNVDRTRLNDPEYVKNISNYLYVNITEGSERTINDWFTYTPTDIEEKNKTKKNSRGEQLANEPISNNNGPNSSVQSVETSEGNVTINSNGIALREDGSPATKEQIDEIVGEQSRTSQPQEQQPKPPTAVSLLVLGTDKNSKKERKKISTKQRELMLKVANSRNPSSGKPLLKSDTTDTSATQDQIMRDLKRVQKMFPTLASQGRIVLVKGMISIVDEKGNPKEAYGLFRDGVLYISSEAPLGTALHEAFHYITDTLLTQTEKDFMFSEAKRMYGDLSRLSLEEKLAESFRNFMNDIIDPTAKGRLRFLWRRLKNIVKSIFGREQYLDNLFWGIYRQKFSNRRENISEDTWKQELIRYKQETLNYDNLTAEQKEYLAQRKFSKENYQNLSLSQKEILLQCM